MGGRKRSLTNHVVGNMDLDLSLVLKGHLALDALVCLFLFGSQKRKELDSQEVEKSIKPGSRLSGMALVPSQVSLSHSIPTCLGIQLSSLGMGTGLDSKGAVLC